MIKPKIYIFLFLFGLLLIACRYDKQTLKENPELITNCWGEAEVQTPHVEEYMIFEAMEGMAYNHHPQVLAYKDKLIASWSNGIWNEDEPGQNMLMSVSEDLGITWSEPTTIFGPRKGIYNDVVFTAMGIRNLGDTLIAYTGVYEYDSILTVKQDHVFPHTKPGYISKYELYTYINVATEIKISTDDGKTWSEAQVLMENFVPNHAPVETSSGRLIMPGNISFPWTDDPTGLRGWEKAAIPRLPDNYTDAPARFRESLKYRGDTVQWLEASFYEMKNGTLRMMFRTDKKRLGVSESHDNGVSWSEPVLTDYTDNHNRFRFGSLPDGRIFGLTTPDPDGIREPLILAVSEYGQHFSKHYVIGNDESTEPRIKGRWKYGRYGYPSHCFYKDYMFVIYTINKEDVAISRFRLSDLD